VKRLLCWRRRSCTIGLTGVNAAGADGGGAVIAFQSSPCLWKKRLHRWRRRNWRQKRRDECDGEGMLVGLSVFSSVYVVSFCSSLSCSRVRHVSTEKTWLLLLWGSVEATAGRVAKLVSGCYWCWPWFSRGGAASCWDFSREVGLRF